MGGRQNPSAQHVHVEVAKDTEDVEIEARPIAPETDVDHRPLVCLDIGDMGLSVTLDVSDAKQLQTELGDAILKACWGARTGEDK